MSALKGKTLHECDDCHNKLFVRSHELTKASRPYCPKCGCTRLIPVASSTNDAILEINTQRYRKIR